MPDVYDPISAQMSSNAAIDQLNALIADLVGRTTCQLELYSNNVAPAPGNSLAAFVEATFSGYSAVSLITPFTDADVGLNPNAVAYADAGIASFACDGGGNTNTIYGAVITATPGTASTATATATESGGVYNSGFTITGAGAGYTRAPKVTLTGATGSGATATATINGAGQVTAITLTNGGTGYTTATVSIEAPLELIKQIVFNNGPISMALATDLINTYAELAEPSINQ